MKVFEEKDVLSAATERIHYLFSTFKHIYFSFSGGKDSGAMIQLADKIAQERNRTFDLLILDIEANYDSTCHFIEEIKALKSIKTCYHFCLPFYEDNNTSIFQPQWLMWNPEERGIWVQPMPIDAIQYEDLDEQLKNIYDASNGNPDRFLRFFSYWYYMHHEKEPIACAIGIRCQESFHRYMAIVKGNRKLEKKSWINQYSEGVYNAYPLYDWKTEDIWGATAKFNWTINEFYNKLYRLGIPLTEMRICQPFGLQQRKGLWQYAAVEPNTWERVVNRVSGANFGSLYARTKLLGHYQTQKPDHMTWQEYTVFLLETIGLYSKKLQDHYYRKIKILMNYYSSQFSMMVDEIPEEASRQDWIQDERLWHNWKGIAKALEKNDFALTTRQYSLTKQDEQELYELYDDYKQKLGLKNLPKKQLERLNRKIEEESDLK
ncbi:phosphoadenosine phosphosulfate reductase [Listeria monocytogenes]|nr:DUF3440 domain-containing protein [Listeria monocytogenes]PCW48137.1 phosphoadenosine phosphosulfate reductase [Listeria monocytogenes]RJA01326.1 DUF3440 domain-containing protein [Listeria monocytogenes]